MAKSHRTHGGSAVIDSPHDEFGNINPSKFTQPGAVKLRDLASWKVGGGGKNRSGIIDSPMADDNKRKGKTHY